MTWEVLQGLPAGALAVVGVVERAHGQVELSLGQGLLQISRRRGLESGLRELLRRKGRVRLLLEYDPRGRAGYRSLVAGLGGLRKDRVRYLMTCPPQLAFNDSGEGLRELISGRSLEGGQLVLVRSRGVPRDPRVTNEFDLLWERALPARALLASSTREARDPDRPIRWTCPSCGRPSGPENPRPRTARRGLPGP